MITEYLTGIGTGAGLIIAIGSQNAFVLTQGIRKQYHLSVALVCALCDTVLISAGVAGMGKLIESSPLLITLAACGGALFLFIYGLKSLLSAIRSGGTIGDNKQDISSRKQVVLTTLAISLLNPHVYLDTVVLLGGISGTFENQGRLFFGAGAITMSYLWFFGLALGAGKLSHLFNKKITWRILDFSIFLIMWVISYRLLKFSRIFEMLFS